MNPMLEIARSDRKTQNRVIDLFTDKTRSNWLGYRKNSTIASV